jgi:signal transduction histidine kinase
MLLIADDGIGFDPDRAADGNGLKNIRRRAARINCAVAIESGPGTGTRITLHRSTG